MPARHSEFGFNLNDAARLLRRDFDRRARTLGLTRSRWQILWHVARLEGTHQAGLAEALDVAPISLARQLDRLQHEGLVERRVDATDKRCYRLFLTPQAAPVLAALHTLAAETRAKAFAGFTDDEIDATIKALARVCANLSSQGTNPR